MLAAVAAAYAAISLFFAVDAMVKINHTLTCPGCGEDADDVREVLGKFGRRGEVALYLLIVGLAFVLWPLFTAVKLLVRTKEES